MAQVGSLSSKRIAVYVLPAVPTAALSVPLSVYIPPLYAETTLLTLGLVGTLFSLSKLIDVITDPLFGWMSDRLMMPLGRRRTWIIASVPLLMVSVYKLFHPPAGAGATYLILWLFLVYLGYTMILLSHLAWGAELGSHYDDRSRILGARQVVATAGMLLVLVLPAIAEANGLVDGTAGRADIMSTFILIALPITVAITALSLPDPLPKDQKPVRFLEFLAIFNNPHLKRLLCADFLMNCAIGITGSLYIWFSVYVFKMADKTSLILVVYFLSATLCVPLWMALAVRFEKHKVFALAMAYGVGTLCIFGLASGASQTFIFAANVLYGVAFGAGIFLARAMVADAADHDELATGKSQMGAFFSGLTLTGKFGFAMGPALAYNLLEQVGFDPKLPVDASGEGWLLFTFIVPPALFFAAAGLVMRGHKLTRAEHARVRAELDAAAPVNEAA